MNAMALEMDPFALKVDIAYSDVRELSEIEIDSVNGGLAPIIVFAAVAVGGFAAGVVVGLAVLYVVDKVF